MYDELQRLAIARAQLAYGGHGAAAAAGAPPLALPPLHYANDPSTGLHSGVTMQHIPIERPRVALAPDAPEVGDE